MIKQNKVNNNIDINAVADAIVATKQQLMTKPEQTTLIPVQSFTKVELAGTITHQPGGNKHSARTAYQISLSLEDFFKLNCKVDVWKAENKDKPSKQGYQRVPEPQRSRKFGYYTLQGNPSYGNYIFNIRDTDKDKVIVRENKTDGTVDITIKPGCEVWICDGGHRCTGLSEFRDDLLADSSGKLKDYQMPVSLTVGLTKKEEIVVFITENQTHKVVATDLAQRAMNDLIRISMKEQREGGNIIFKDYTYVKSSYAIVDLMLNNNKQFKGRLRQPNKTPSQAPLTTVSEKGFSDSLKPLIGTRYAPLFKSKDEPDKVYRVLNNFWQAIEQICPEPFAPAKPGIHDPRDYVIQQNIGIYSLHKLLAKIATDAEISISKLSKDQFVDLLDIGHMSHTKWKAANEKKGVDGGKWTEYGTNQKSFEMISDELIGSIRRQKSKLISELQ